MNPTLRVLLVGLIPLLPGSEVYGTPPRDADSDHIALPEHGLLQLGSGDFCHGSYISQLATVPDSSRIMTFGGDRSVRVWDETGVLVRSIPGHRGLSNSAFTIDGRWRLGTVRESDPMQPGRRQYFRSAENLVTGVEIRVGPVESTAYSMSITADGKLLAVGDPGAVLSLIDTETGQTLASEILPGPQNHAGYPHTFLSPDGAILLAEQPEGNWFIFDLKDRNLQHPLESIGKFRHAKPVFSSEKGIGAMIGWDGRILIRDFYRERNLVEFRHSRATALDGAFSPDDQMLATCGADGFIRLWKAGDGQLIREISTEERHPNAVSFLADGKTLISGGGQGRVRFWNVASGVEQLQDEKTSGFGAVKGVAITPDGKTGALAGGLGEICLWDLKSGERLGELSEGVGLYCDPWIGQRFLAFTPDGETLVAGSSKRGSTVNLWDVKTRRLSTRFSGHRSPVTCVACSPDGESIVSGSRDRSVLAWNTSGNQIWQATGNGAQILTLAFSPDGTRVYSAGHTSKIDVWNAKDGTSIQSFEVGSNPQQGPLDAISALAVSRKDEYVAVAMGSSTSGYQVVVTDLRTGEPVYTIGSSGLPFFHSGADTFLCVAFHPQRDLLAVGIGNGGVAIHAIPSGKTVETLHGHRAAVTSVAWSLNGSQLLSGSSDGTAYLWDTEFLKVMPRGDDYQHE